MERSSSSSTSTDHLSKEFDVFISFRGSDARNSFVGFLYEALGRLGIKVFIDENKLHIGIATGELILQAIEQSRCSIVVLSKEYASSRWCLRELTKIVDVMGTTHHVLPVFYHVDPCDVQNQSGVFEFFLEKHEAATLQEESEERLKEIQTWKNAMKKLVISVELSSEKIEIVEQITNQIHAWCPKLVAMDQSLVGMTSRLFQLEVNLALGLDDVRFIGIVGSNGIGKITIVKVVYNCLIREFEEHCFLNLFGSDPKQSLVLLQQQMLSSIFHKEDVKVLDENSRPEMIRNRLSGRKVLLILDGVDDKRQLENLAGSSDWFGPGSRVIFTTRNEDLLRQLDNIEVIEYIVEELDHDSALQLFLKFAFATENPSDDFMALSIEIVEKLEGLPLALRVIGSLLHGREIRVWRDILKRLDEKDLSNLLKISNDGLGAET